MRASPTIPMVLLILMVVAACGGDGDAPAGGKSPSFQVADSGKAIGQPAEATPGPLVESAGAAVDTSAAAGAAHADSCVPEPATSASVDWTRFEPSSGEFSFAHPASWERVAWIRVTGVFDSRNYAEAGLPADTVLAAAVIVAPPLRLELARDTAGFPNVVVYRLEGVTSPIDTLYAREEDKFRSFPQVKQVLRTGLRRCVAGSPAIGLEFLFLQDVVNLETMEQSQGDEQAYQQSWLVSRDGALYHVQFLAQDSSTAGVLEEILRTWRWSSTGGERVEAGTRPAFAEARMASAADPSAEAPDPASFTSNFPGTASAIYVVYRLKEGAGGRVTATWTKDGEVLLQDERGRKLPSDGTWAFEAITPPPGGFPPGSYEVVLRIVETGESRAVPFTVTGEEGGR